MKTVCAYIAAQARQSEPKGILATMPEPSNRHGVFVRDWGSADRLSIAQQLAVDIGHSTRYWERKLTEGSDQ